MGFPFNFWKICTRFGTAALFVHIAGASLCAAPALLATPNITASQAPFNSSYAAPNIFDEKVTIDAVGNIEPVTVNQNGGWIYATWGTAADAYLEFDFGYSVDITEIAFWDRDGGGGNDRNMAFNIIFSTDPTFGDMDDVTLTFDENPLTGADFVKPTTPGPLERYTISAAASGVGNSISARYVRWESTQSGTAFDGVAELRFLRESIDVSAPEELVSYWPLDGNGIDAVGGNDGAPRAAADLSVPGKVGSGALSTPNIASNADCVDMGNRAGLDFEADDPWTIAFWVRGDGGGDDALVGKMQQGGTYPGYEIHVGTNQHGGDPVGGNDKLTIWLINDVWTGNMIQVDGSVDILRGTGEDDWVHVAVTYDGSGTADGVQIYVDGQADTAQILTKDALAGSILNDASFSVGARQGGANHGFSGDLDEVAVWDVVLSGSSIAGLADGTYTPLTAPISGTVTLAGDLDGDGYVGSGDLDIVRANWGAIVTPGTLLSGDPSGDGVVGSADLDIVRANWGSTAAASVPEPAMIALLTVGLIATSIRRRLVSCEQ